MRYLTSAAAIVAASYASPALAASSVQLRTSDGLVLHALADVPRGATKGVILVHMAGRSSADWAYFAERLDKGGLATIAPDLRGNGRSKSARPHLTDADYPAMVADVEAAAGWLRSHGITEIECAGASLGANLCLAAAAVDKGIVNVVMLSPGLNYKGITTGDKISAYGDRPILFVASSEDTYSARSANLLDQRAKGQHLYELLDGAGHGTRMLNRDPNLEGLVMSWLLGTYTLASGKLVVPKPDIPASTDKIETTGKKLNAE